MNDDENIINLAILLPAFHFSLYKLLLINMLADQ